MSRPIHILVVEDEPFILFVMGEHLQDEGFTVSLARNANEALSLLEKNADISLMFTDIDMPGGMNGLALSSMVRDRWPSVKIIITSGQRQVEITEIPDGAMFFSKPYDHEEVVSSMRELLHNA